MDPATISASTILLARVRAGSPALLATVTYASSTYQATLDPAVDLEPGASYRLTVKPQVENVCGDPQRRQVTATFATEP